MLITIMSTYLGKNRDKYGLELVTTYPSKSAHFLDIPKCKVSFVQILAGIDKGKQGLVCTTIKERNWCYVEGLNCIFKWVGKSATNPGVLTKIEKPLLVTSEISLLDPSDLQPTEVEWRYDDDGNRVRVSLRSGRVIPISKKALDLAEDFVDKNEYLEQSWDTKEKDLLKVTFKPLSKSFEQDIMDSLGIKETRKRAPNFYY